MVMTADDIATREAAQWSALLHGAANAPPEFEAWLARNAANREAWSQVETTMARFDALAGDSARIAAILSEGRADAQRHRAERLARRTRRRHVGLALAACVVFSVAAGGAVLVRKSMPAIYETGRGERRTVTLSDGSTVALDASTRLTVRYSGRARTLDLEHGQARFEVAHDTARPFSVHAGDRTVVATGTRFDVDVLGARVIVTLLQGHVVVLPGREESRSLSAPALGRRLAAAPGKVDLAVGQRLLATENAAPAVVEAVDAREAQAWREGILVFDAETLKAAAERVSRYTPRPVVVADPRIANTRVTGSFKAGDLPAFVEAVTTILPLEAVTQTDGSVRLESHRS